jgi:hypothetical protein
MHDGRGIQPVGWMRIESNNRKQPLQCRHGLVIYFDVSKWEPAFLNSFLLSCLDEPANDAHICTQIPSAFSSEVSNKQSA